jgi:hypothetical protein
MPVWKKIVVGDAFRLPSRNINYYRDLFLLCPFMIFAVAGVFKLVSHQWVVGAESSGIALGALLLARERLFLFLGAVGFCAVRFLFVIALTQDWRGYVGLLVSGLVLLVFGRFAKSYKPSYGWPEGPSPSLSWVCLLSCSLSERSCSSTTSPAIKTITQRPYELQCKLLWFRP